ncbi:YihY/virulence factor BrkB family protein [uncultured Paludibaculum sp.]|uniref:YihY/virulence factor BrkB family protein n=1 Tax=uncultured Paludibaculum sp. TaxID=1765020 RepID=UPI002AAA6B1F|nr:YihY/virulence factor BrkB family protein [uncultured Paludibaculum sp.]
MYRLPAKELAVLIEETLRNWHEDRAPRMGAALAYYLAISLAPTIVIVLAVAGWAFGSQAAEGRLIWQTQNLVGLEGAKVIQSMIDGAHQPLRGATASVLGLITLFFGATAVVSELTDSLNTIWKVPDEKTFSPSHSLLEMLKERLVSFVIVLGSGLFLLASLILNVWISFAGEYLRSVAAPPPALIRTVDWIVTFVVITALLAFIFKVLPNVQLEWSDVAVGAVLTSLLFAAGRLLLSVYLTEAGFKDSYGAAGSLVVLLVWVYYSAQVLYLGAEFTRAYTRRYGSMAVERFRA